MRPGYSEELERKRKRLRLKIMDGKVGDPIRIPLTKNKWAIVDRDMAHLADYNWFYHHEGYAVRSLRPIKTHIYLHHCVIGRPLFKLEVDHINLNSLDNRRENLRIVTSRENKNNNRRKKLGIASSGYPGVIWNKKLGKWVSRIWMNGKDHYLGLFMNEKLAASAYNIAFERMKDSIK
jgi:hypothetical protein